VLAVHIDDVTVPSEPVVSVSVFVSLANTQVGICGSGGTVSGTAVKITDTPDAGFPFIVTVATNGAAKAVPTVAL
jgi:hypothetical protein